MQKDNNNLVVIVEVEVVLLEVEVQQVHQVL